MINGAECLNSEYVSFYRSIELNIPTVLSELLSPCTYNWMGWEMGENMFFIYEISDH